MDRRGLVPVLEMRAWDKDDEDQRGGVDAVRRRDFLLEMRRVDDRGNIKWILDQVQDDGGEDATADER